VAVMIGKQSTWARAVLNGSRGGDWRRGWRPKAMWSTAKRVRAWILDWGLAGLVGRSTKPDGPNTEHTGGDTRSTPYLWVGFDFEGGCQSGLVLSDVQNLQYRMGKWASSTGGDHWTGG